MFGPVSQFHIYLLMVFLGTCFVHHESLFESVLSWRHDTTLDTIIARVWTAAATWPSPSTTSTRTGCCCWSTSSTTCAPTATTTAARRAWPPGTGSASTSPPTSAAWSGEPGPPPGGCCYYSTCYLFVKTIWTVTAVELQTINWRCFHNQCRAFS